MTIFQSFLSMFLEKNIAFYAFFTIPFRVFSLICCAFPLSHPRARGKIILAIF
jgi:hypothetical protein